MLSFSLNDEQRQLQFRAQTFGAEVLTGRVAEMDATNAYPWDVVQQLANLGFMGLTIPIEYGGGGRPLIDAILVAEELAKVCGTVARIVVDANTAVQKTIVTHGTQQQKQKYLPRIVQGDKPVIAITEPEAGSAATWLTTSATRDGSDYVINGRKRWITGAGVSKSYLVFARFDKKPGAEGIGGILVDAESPGLAVPRVPMMMGLRGMPEGDVEFVDCRVPAGNLVVASGGGFAKLMNCYNLQRVGAAAVALGIAQGAFDLAAAYAVSRRQFGQRIGDFQGVQWMLADMHIQLECARMLVYRAAVNGVDGYPDRLEAACAKVHAAEMAIEVTNAALQIFGAAGYSCDLPIERMVRDARMFTIGGGTAQVQRNLIGKEILSMAENRHPDHYEDRATPLSCI
jgi:alkylation response protein AidB-like acyl-CoA dehydrogenase